MINKLPLHSKIMRVNLAAPIPHKWTKTKSHVSASQVGLTTVETSMFFFPTVLLSLSLPSAPCLFHDKDKKAIYWPALAMLNNSRGVQLLQRPRNSGFHLSVTFKTRSPPSASITITAGDPRLTHTHTTGKSGGEKDTSVRLEGPREAVVVVVRSPAEPLVLFLFR